MKEPIRRRERAEVRKRTAPAGRVVYQAILAEGEVELTRTSSALFWSGVAAGTSMGFSMIAQGLLAAYLPTAGWRPLISSLGYTVGFLIVVLGRQQLFTENTLTPILPLLVHKNRAILMNVVRLWFVVLTANLLGGLVIAWVAVRAPVFVPAVQDQFLELGSTAMQHGFWGALLRGIFAGWLIASMVWLLPFAESARIWVIVIITYLVGLGQFTHVIAGSIEVFAVAAGGLQRWSSVFLDYVLPTFIGNVVGGLTLVAALNHAQVVAGTGGRASEGMGKDSEEGGEPA